MRADGGAIANAIAKVIGEGAGVADDPRARLGGQGSDVTAFVTATTVDDGVAAGRAGPARLPAAPISWSEPARARRRCRELVAIHRVDELRGMTSPTRTPLGALATPRGDRPERRSSSDTALADASAIVGSHAPVRRARRGQPDERISRDGDGRPARLLRGDRDARSKAGDRTVAVGDLFTGPGSTVAEPGRAADRDPPHTPPAGRGAAYLRLEYRRQMEIAVVGATAVVTVVGGAVTAARVAMTALAPTIGACPRQRPPCREATVGRTRSPRQAQRWRLRRRRSPTCAARPTTGGRWRP